MSIAELIAKRSTCARMKTAAVVVRDKRIVSIGYNGVPAGSEHCEELKRPTWSDTFMSIAELIAKRSTCARMKTAAVVVRDKRIVSIGYNGVPAGSEHCEDHWRNKFRSLSGYNTSDSEFSAWQTTESFAALHHDWATANELHAEQNAILYAAKTGISTENASMYTLYSPCIHCAKVILSSGIKEVFFKYFYARDTSGLDLLKDNGVSVTHCP